MTEAGWRRQLSSIATMTRGEDFMTENCFLNHWPPLSKGISLIEFCCNLGKLHDSELEIYALPLKIVDCDGSPARVIAVAR